MKDIIELLQNERTKTVDALKQGEQDKLSHLQQLDKALGWLKVVEDNELATVGSYKIHRLPDPRREMGRGRNTSLPFSFQYRRQSCSMQRVRQTRKYYPKDRLYL